MTTVGLLVCFWGVVFGFVISKSGWSFLMVFFWLTDFFTFLRFFFFVFLVYVFFNVFNGCSLVF